MDDEELGNLLEQDLEAAIKSGHVMTEVNEDGETTYVLTDKGQLFHSFITMGTFIFKDNPSLLEDFIELTERLMEE